MSTAIESYGTLYSSPFLLSPLLEAFYERADVQPKSILLAYLVLPLTLPPTSRQFLAHSNTRSSLRTFCKEPARLYGLPKRLQECRELTHTCLQMAVDASGLRVESDLSVTHLGAKLDASLCPKDTVRAAKHLGKLFHPLDIPAIYRFLGVRQL